MKKNVLLSCLLGVVLSVALVACASEKIVGDPVALTVAAIDLEATQLWRESQIPTPSEETVEPVALIERAPEFTLNTNVHLAEAKVYEGDNIKVAVLSLQYEDPAGPALTLLIENASSNSLMLRVNEVAVNDFMLNSDMEVSVAAGQSSIENLSLAIETLNRMGIDAIHSVEFSLRIIENDNWSKSITTERIRVETTARQSDALAQDQQTTLLVEREGVRISLKKLDTLDNDPKLILYLLVENNTDIDITVEVQELFINGISFRPVYRKTLLAGYKSMDMVYLLAGEESLENEHQAETLEIAFEVTNSESKSRVFKTDLLKINIE